MAARQYNDEFKEKVLSDLRTNGYSYYKTAKAFHISINTLKAWDDYPNNLPAQLKKKRQTKKTTDCKNYTNAITQENLPDSIDAIESIAIKEALKSGILLLNQIKNPKDYLDVVRALSELIKLPDQSKYSKPKSALEELLRIHKEQSTSDS
jgi:transposase-like protein